MRSVAPGASATAAPLVFLDDLLELFEPSRQHVREEAVEVVEALGADAVEAARAVAPLLDQPRLLEHRQVLGDCRLSDGEPRCLLPGAALAAREQPEAL